MTLAELLPALGELAPVETGLDPSTGGRTIKAVVYDSRKAGQGSLFVALHGEKVDGTAFAAQAVARGAVAVVSERSRPEGIQVPWIAVADARLALARLGASFYGHPSRDLRVVGITGTNGKTTTAYLLAALFEAAGIKCGMFGTVVYRIGDEERAATRTTPESVDMQQMLREMVKRGSGACVMEVSSHALAQRRADGISFAAAIFTNLTRDHLDYHRDMESYFRAKRRLFELLPPGAPAIVNVDDPRGASLAGIAARTVTYAVDRQADVHPVRLMNTLHGLDFDVDTPAGHVAVRSRLVGRPNVYNIVAAVAAAVSLGLPIDAIERGLGGIEGVPGRFQVVSRPGDDVTVIVDYAHTDDALKNLLETVRPLARQRLITVFGCGGERDRTKRPLMGAVAARLSDLVIITSDNPRGEDPAEIIEEVKRGIVMPAERTRPAKAREGQYSPPRATAHMGIVDRRTAIDRALALAKPGDVVVIAGKGHEQYQVIGDRELPFDDAQVAREALARRKGGA
jgi:UDP-N-acetylmuramoyl-L-alanyl-D-glutamate--2,6-diaminopimelate ligase